MYVAASSGLMVTAESLARQSRREGDAARHRGSGCPLALVLTTGAYPLVN